MIELKKRIRKEKKKGDWGGGGAWAYGQIIYGLKSEINNGIILI
jgi:hypothetical protein